jgi:SNF2 family DNA or RNA helicase
MKLRPFKHQQDEFNAHGLDEVRAIHWEQGTGKTYITLWEAEELYKKGLIDCLIVVAPNGLHTNWVNYEIPDLVSVKHKAFAYHSKKANTKKHKGAIQQLYDYRDGLAILTMSYDAAKTAEGKKWLKKFLQTRRAFYVLDESNRIKTPGSATTRAMVASGNWATYKRTLCGTPITNKPFDIYTQFRFLDPGYWRNTPYGLSEYEDFKTFFGIWQRNFIETPKGKREFKTCVSYQNLNILSELVAKLSSRVLKEDVLKDLPPKLYAYKGFEMTAKQQELYTQLETEFMTCLGGEMIFTPLAITRMLRLQQVSCGYLPTGDENKCTPIEPGKANPRIKLLDEITQDLPHKAIIWARFTEDINQICDLLGDKAVRWDGTTPDDQREENKCRFKKCPVKEVRFLVATPESMGEGHTLNEAKTMIYYSNSYKLKERLQSEDRNHRAGQTSQVNIIDIIADNTKDIEIINALRGKFNTASAVIDGRFREWLLTYDGQSDILAKSDWPSGDGQVIEDPYALFRGFD